VEQDGYKRNVLKRLNKLYIQVFFYTGCVKISLPTLTRYNFDKGGPIFIFFNY